MIKAIGYARVSSTEQVSGTSLDCQREQIEAYSKALGIELMGVMVDAGISGSKPLASRPAGSQVFEALKNGEVDMLIIAKLDRAFRNCSDCLNNIAEWEKAGISLVILNMSGQQVDTRTPMGKFFITMLSAVGELERNMINERCDSGRKARKAQGYAVSHIPFGYDADETGKLLPNSTEQQIISLVHTLKSEGLSNARIALELNNREIKTKLGSLWTHTQVGRILKIAA